MTADKGGDEEPEEGARIGILRVPTMIFAISKPGGQKPSWWLMMKISSAV